MTKLSPPPASAPNLAKRLFFFAQRLLNAATWVVFAPLLAWRLRPRRAFAPAASAPPPDYSRGEHWAVRPEAPRQSAPAPSGNQEETHRSSIHSTSEPRCDVFYVHPTMHLTGESWNAPLDHDRINELVDQLVVPGQASVFARTCRVFAPRYRQATLYSFVGGNDSCRQALELAYSDVKAAFLHYLEQDNRGRPFFIASHSQGSCHAIRLLEECVEPNAEVCDRLICAYVLGYTVPRDKFVVGDQAGQTNQPDTTGQTSPAFRRLHPSRGPRDLCCVVSWDTFGASGGPLKRSDRAEVWYSGEAPGGKGAPSPSSNGHWRRRSELEILGIHPFTFDQQPGWMARDRHVGAIHPKFAARISPGALLWRSQKPLGIRFKRLSEPYPKLVAAALRDDGYLFISEPMVGAFQRAILPGRSFHNHDYSLFYCDLEANVAARALAYFESEE